MNKLVPKAITFDVYGTIIDWEGEIQNFFKDFLAKKGIKNVTPYQVQQRWEILQFDYIKEYRPYRQVLKDTLAITCKDFGFEFTDEDCNAFAESMSRWKAFPDSKDAIAELRKYTKVVMLTNTDNDIIRESLKNAGIVVDDIITAQDAGCYKPQLGGFLLSQKKLGLTADEMMHAGFGFKYDVIPGNKLGYRTIWVNRQGIVRPIDGVDGSELEYCKEDIMCGDLKTLAYIIKGMAATDAENEAANK
jgi:2-haloalkanoic acid dehalogenase type II